MKRLNIYVDGFNLYFGMTEAGYSHCKWLDIEQFANNLKHNSHTVNKIKYFTSRISNNQEKQKRQNTYLDALNTKNIEVIYGEFRSALSKCVICGNNWYESKEKKTDVNIATHLISDAYKNDFDVAILVTGDSDLVPPVKAVRELFPHKEIRLAFPPNRESNELKKAASGSFQIGVKKLEASQFPLTIVNKYGTEIHKPPEWT